MLSRAQSLELRQRWHDVGHGSDALDRAVRLAAAERAAGGPEFPASRWQQRAGAWWLRSYELRPRRVDLPLTDTPHGRMIRQHLGIRHAGRWSYRHAQGLLPLPDTYAAYLRGRHRQAVRTNLRRAAAANLSVTCELNERWVPGVGDDRLPYLSAGPVERWIVWLDGRGVADAIVSVDTHVALLHGLMTYPAPNFPAGVPFVRWLLHAAIVERLCGQCEFLFANSVPVHRLPAGNRHFQRLLGYEIATLRPTPAGLRAPSPGLPRAALGAPARA